MNKSNTTKGDAAYVLLAPRDAFVYPNAKRGDLMVYGTAPEGAVVLATGVSGGGIGGTVRLTNASFTIDVHRHAPADVAMECCVSGNAQMRLGADGAFGIGASYGFLDGDGSARMSVCGRSNLILEAGGNVGVGTRCPKYELDVNGTINANHVCENGTPVVDLATQRIRTQLAAIVDRQRCNERATQQQLAHLARDVMARIDEHVSSRDVERHLESIKGDVGAHAALLKGVRRSVDALAARDKAFDAKLDALQHMDHDRVVKVHSVRTEVERMHTKTDRAMLALKRIESATRWTSNFVVRWDDEVRRVEYGVKTHSQSILDLWQASRWASNALAHVEKRLDDAPRRGATGDKEFGKDMLVWSSNAVGAMMQHMHENAAIGVDPIAIEALVEKCRDIERSTMARLDLALSSIEGIKKRTKESVHRVALIPDTDVRELLLTIGDMRTKMESYDAMLSSFGAIPSGMAPHPQRATAHPSKVVAQGRPDALETFCSQRDGQPIVEVRDEFFYPPYATNPPMVHSTSKYGVGLSASHKRASIVFYVGEQASLPVERARINECGYLGIGTAKPEYMVDVQGDGNFRQVFEDGVALASKYMLASEIDKYARTTDLKRLEETIMRKLTQFVRGEVRACVAQLRKTGGINMADDDEDSRL